MIESISLIVTIFICFPAFILAAQRSSWLVDYLFLVVAFNRGIRRVVDYQNGYFNQLSLISLTPLIVGGLATVVVLLELQQGRRVSLGSRTQRGIYVYGIAVVLAFAVGFHYTRFGAVYALGDYIAPIGLLGFGAMFVDQPNLINRWCQSMALCALFVAIYGIWQFYTIPPWDAFWVRETKMLGYLGTLESTKMSLFSTMAERGVAAAFLCGGLILIALRPNFLGILRIPCVAVVLVAMLLTYARTAIIQFGLAVVLFPLLNRGSGLVPVIGLSLLAILFGPILLDRLPGSNKAAARLATIGDLQNDGSLRGRIELIGITGGASLTEPFGLGIGSHGLSSRVTSSAAMGSGDSTGYIETLRTFGWFGTLMIVLVLYRIWKASAELLIVVSDDANVHLFRTWFVSGLAAMFSGNWMFTATFFWVLAGYVLGKADILDSESEWSELEYEESNDTELPWDTWERSPVS